MRRAIAAAAVLATLAVVSFVLLRLFKEAAPCEAPFSINVTAGVRKLRVGISLDGDLRLLVVVEPLGSPLHPYPLSSESERVLEVECNRSCAVEVGVAGGRGYRVTVSSGSCNLSATVPYVRELEDLASALAERGIVVSAAYMPWRMGEVLGASWRGDVPLLGLYDASSDYVQWRHIDWARGHGIHVFWVDWTMYASTPAGGRIYNVTLGLLEKGMVVGVMIGPQVSMRWGSGYPSIDLSDGENARIFLGLIRMALPLMKHPNYYRVDGRPAIMIWNEGALYNRGAVYERMRELVESELGVEPYVIADALPRIERGVRVSPGTPEGRWFIDNLLLRRGDGGDRCVDAYTSWIGFYAVQGQRALAASDLARYPELYREHLAAWQVFAKARGKRTVPTLSPGFDRTHDPSFRQPWPIPRNLSRFLSMLEAAVRSLEGGGEVRIDTWNDFFEGTFIEPSAAEGLEYLEAIRRALSALAPADSG